MSRLIRDAFITENIDSLCLLLTVYLKPGCNFVTAGVFLVRARLISRQIFPSRSLANTLPQRFIYLYLPAENLAPACISALPAREHDIC